MSPLDCGPGNRRADTDSRRPTDGLDFGKRCGPPVAWYNALGRLIVS
ncbi:hypothetical protein FRUB_01335 [Fimbriiglobus ruber]|uniref:Uncharacterized protein n=1 Tax=Fimbriiglobus ruber TaxID=1908690 RepID=A0A225DZK3_9BACT|nr:hypothetical protein FRUB_01335 [Fimbriiglobus ruber]